MGFSVYSLTDNFHSEWGFFGHKRINRLAVFTLPEDMLPLFKKEIEFVTEHAVDPDKRRYATKHEAVRHYIDIDQWGTYPYDNVPRKFNEALMRFSQVMAISPREDTVIVSWKVVDDSIFLDTKNSVLSQLTIDQYRDYFYDFVAPNYYEGPIFDATPLLEKLNSKRFISLYILDKFSEHGILPYNLVAYQNKLTYAFKTGNLKRALRLATEMGHYIGDAHVPLHTTTNYNGQLTDQIGIHAFWESRIPELFADETFDYFVGQAKEVEDIETFYWDIVLSSHQLVDSVLLIEKRLSKTFPLDRQYCYEDRNFRNVSLPCPEYALAYAEEMDGMVEERFRASILAIGSAWYTAWARAGRPDLSGTEVAIEVETTDSTKIEPTRQSSPHGRQHWD